MSTPEILAAKVAELCASGQLVKLPPAVAGDEFSYARTLWVSLEVLYAVNSTAGETQTAMRHTMFGAALDAFINWEEVSVAEKSV